MINIGLHPSISALLISQPGLKRDSYCSLIRATPSVTILCVEDFRRVIENLPGDCAANCIILDCTGSDPDPHVLTWIANTKRCSPTTRCLVINDAAKLDNAYLSAGAELTLPGSFSFQDLQRAFQVLFTNG